MLRLLPSSLDDLSGASAAACVKTAALIGGPEALRLLARWSPDSRSPVQRALAQVWRYFDPTDYAEAVLRDATLDDGRIEVKLVEHVMHLRRLQHLRDARLDLRNTDPISDLAFLQDVPPVITWLYMYAEGSVDLGPLSNCPALELLIVGGPGVSTGVEVLPRLTALTTLVLTPSDRGRDVSFLGDCPKLRTVHLYGCRELTNLSTLVSASGVKYVRLARAECLRDLRALNELTNLRELGIDAAPLPGGIDAVRPVLEQLKALYVWSVPTATSLETLIGSTLELFDLRSCPVSDLAPLATLQSLKQVSLGGFATVNVTPVATLPHVRDLHLLDVEEPVDLSPLARIDHRLRVHLRNTETVGAPGSLVKIKKS